MPGKRFERSIKKKDTYEALRAKGMDKSHAARIANAQANNRKPRTTRSARKGK